MRSSAMRAEVRRLIKLRSTARRAVFLDNKMENLGTERCEIATSASPSRNDEMEGNSSTTVGVTEGVGAVTRVKWRV